MKSNSCNICAFWNSSIGKKVVVALTGIVLVLFLAGHLSGNLLIFVGEEAFNDYAHFLHHFLHGTGVWIARIVLLTCLVLHVTATIQLTRINKASRKDYEKQTTVQATKSSTIMIWSGLTILAFIIFHLLHFTIRVNSGLDQLAETSPWMMAIAGFQNFFVVVFYIIAMSLLCSHLSHGTASIFQTLGLRTAKTAGLIKKLALGYSIVIWVGFVSIPLFIFFGFGEEALNAFRK